jgi:hypothetical protein
MTDPTPGVKPDVPSNSASDKPPVLSLPAIESRVADLEKAFASFAAPALGVIEHDAHAAAQSWVSKFRHLFTKPVPTPDLTPEKPK